MPGPAFYIRAQLRAYRGVRNAGYTIGHALEAMQLATKAVVDQAVAESSPEVIAAVKAIPDETAQKVGAIGDGTIIQDIETFLASPLGQALESALVKLLIAALAA